MTQDRHVEGDVPQGQKVRIPAVVGGLALGVVAGAVIWIVALSGGIGLRTPPGTQAMVGQGQAEQGRGIPGPGEPGMGSKAAPAGTASEAARTTAATPGFDTVRAEADGSVVVAGRASAGAVVTIDVNGAATAEAQADGQGRFAAFLTLQPGANPNVVTLSAKGVDGAITRSGESVILKPVEPSVAAVAVEAPKPSTGAAVPDAVVDGSANASAQVAVSTAPEASQALLADAEGVRKLAAGTSASVVIDTISYGADGAVELAGRAIAGAGPHVRVYLDNTEAGTAPVAGDGQWTMRLLDVSPRLHALRVDQLDEAGKVVSRFETPFLREDAAKLADTGAASKPAAEQANGAATGASEAGTTSPDAGVAALQTPVKAAIITVQPGYTLWAIAKASYGSGPLYVKVFEANRDQIRNPDLIYPGQVFSVPGD